MRRGSSQNVNSQNANSQNINFPKCQFPKCQLLKFGIFYKRKQEEEGGTKEKDIEKRGRIRSRREENFGMRLNYTHPSVWLTKETVCTGCLGDGEHVVLHDIHEDVTCTGVHRLPPQLLADPPHHHPQELVCVLLTHH